MQLVREIEVAGRRVRVRELTVGEIRLWLREARSDGDGVDWALFEELSLFDIYRMTDLLPLGAESMTPSELREIIAVAKEINSDFFALRGRLERLARELRATSTAPSAASSQPATPARGTTRGRSFFQRLMHST